MGELLDAAGVETVEVNALTMRKPKPRPGEAPPKSFVIRRPQVREIVRRPFFAKILTRASSRSLESRRSHRNLKSI